MTAELVAFGVRWSIFCAGLFLLLGMLPLSSRPEAARRPGGAALVVLDLLVLPVLVVATLRHGLAAAPWTWIVVIAGLLLLVGPFLLQPLPSSWREGRAALALLFVLSLVALFV